MESTAPWEGACKMRGEPWPQSAHSSPLCWVSTSKVDFYIVDIPHELRWILLSINFASSICRIHVLIVSLVTVGSLASTGHDHILKQHKIRLNLLILVYPITRGQKERGNQGTGPLQGTKTFCMKTSKSAALVQDFKVSRFQGFKISPGFSSWAPGRCHHSLFHCCAFTLKLATYRQKAQGIFRLTNL